MLLGLTGKKEVGKDTTFQRIKALYYGRCEIERVAFGDAMKRSAAAALGVTVEDLERWKNDPQVKLEVVGFGGQWLLPKRLTARQYLQNYGYEAHRQIFGKDFWENLVKPNIMNHSGKLVVVTDIRVDSEAKLVREHGGFVTEVVGSNLSFDTHATEIPISRNLVDYVIRNPKRDDSYLSLDEEIVNLFQAMPWETLHEVKVK